MLGSVPGDWVRGHMLAWPGEVLAHPGRCDFSDAGLAEGTCFPGLHALAHTLLLDVLHVVCLDLLTAVVV
jgi:hypothetical protein